MLIIDSFGNAEGELTVLSCILLLSGDSHELLLTLAVNLGTEIKKWNKYMAIGGAVHKRDFTKASRYKHGSRRWSVSVKPIVSLPPYPHQPNSRSFPPGICSCRCPGAQAGVAHGTVARRRATQERWLVHAM
jgi:hypothetical protein